MNTKFLLISILAVLLSFAAGFLLANSLNSNEIAKLQSENATLQKQQKPENAKQNELNLTNEEIEKKIKEAEQNPNDFGFQKGLGLALYRYAAVKQDKALLERITSILERAYKLNSDDYLLIVSLGNLYYDLGQMNKDNESNLKARKLYAKALEKNEKDSNVRTDFALTYLLTDSPDREFAIQEFKKALEINPKNEKALVYITQAFIETGKNDEAEKFLAKVKELNPKNPKIAEYETALSQK